MLCASGSFVIVVRVVVEMVTVMVTMMLVLVMVFVMSYFVTILKLGISPASVCDQHALCEMNEAKKAGMPRRSFSNQGLKF